MKTEQLRDELAMVIANADTYASAQEKAQAVIDHIAPMMLNVVEALKSCEHDEYEGWFDAELVKQALESIPEEWRK